jgi:predicted amidohydrolase YtcJ
MVGRFLIIGEKLQHSVLLLGALGSWGAALLEPYSDKRDTKGIMRISSEDLEDFVQKFWEDGWGIVSPTANSQK